MIKRKNKFFVELFPKGPKGELTTQQIVTMIVVITSFAIILFLLFRLNLGETTEAELCHNSVVMRGNAVIPTDAVPLNCHRKYICITEDGSCEGLTGPEVVKVKKVDEVYEKLAEEMANCWWMFGEGSVNYIGNDLGSNNYCSICSQVLFDDSLSSLEINKDELYEFLRDNKIDEKNSYAEYLFGTNDLDLLKSTALNEKGIGTFGNLEIGKQYFVVMGITNNVESWKWAGVGTGAGAVAGVVAGFFILSNPIGWVGGAIVVGSSLVGGVAGGLAGEVSESIDPEIAALTVEGRGIENNFMAPTIIESNSDKFNALNCEEILTLA